MNPSSRTARPVAPPVPGAPTRSSGLSQQADKDPDARRAVVIEDHPMVANTISHLVAASSRFVLVGVAGTVDEALRAWPKWEAEVAVIDVELSGEGSGLDLAERLLTDQPDLVVVFYSGTTDESIVTRAVEVGARGFLSKQADPRDLLPKLVEACAGDRLAFDHVTASLVVSGMRSPSPEEPSALTGRERQTLEHVARGRTNEQIGRQLGVSAATVKTLLARARVKLDAPDRASAVNEAIKRGEIQPQ